MWPRIRASVVGVQPAETEAAGVAVTERVWAEALLALQPCLVATLTTSAYPSRPRLRPRHVPMIRSSSAQDARENPQGNRVSRAVTASPLRSPPVPGVHRNRHMASAPGSHGQGRCGAVSVHDTNGSIRGEDVPKLRGPGRRPRTRLPPGARPAGYRSGWTGRNASTDRARTPEAAHAPKNFARSCCVTCLLFASLTIGQ